MSAKKATKKEPSGGDNKKRKREMQMPAFLLHAHDTQWHTNKTYVYIQTLRKSLDPQQGVDILPHVQRGEIRKAVILEGTLPKIHNDLGCRGEVKPSGPHIIVGTLNPGNSLQEQTTCGTLHRPPRARKGQEKEYKRYGERKRERK